MIHTFVDTDKDIIFVKYEGTITVSDIVNNTEEIVSLKSKLPGELKILTDVVSAIFEIRVDEISLIMQETKRLLKVFGKVREAFVQNSPYVTVLSVLYVIELDNLDNYVYSLFTKTDNAIDWLNEI